ncbi:condensation domain-containing protein [Kitasatospora sp. NPDC101235]|uniref:condensation domain-containing protein n=1 Tax=Kitasatospora sp. NPDC101235 TaxID=3364101 RepID=UPI0037FEB86B
MTIEDHYADLVARGVRLADQDGRLRCAAPAGVLTDALLKEVSARKDELLAHLAERRVPLSYPQEQLWVVHRLDQAGCAYHEPVLVELEGPLQPTALRRALDAVYHRHEVLRTVYPTHRGRPHQVVLEPGSCPLAVVDLTDLPREAREEAARQWVEREVRRPFDLTTGPVLRAVLLALDTERYRLLLTRHHIAGDGWSLGLLLRDLGDAYDAARSGRPPTPPPNDVRYTDFAEWQRAVRRRDPLGTRGAERVRALRGAPVGLRLPAPGDLAADTRDAPVARTVDVRLDPEPAAGVRALADQARVTPFTVLLTAYAAVLSHCCDQDDMLIGSPVAGRPRAEYEHVVGTFANLLPIRVRLDGDPPLDTLLRRVHTEVMGALEARDVPFGALVAEIAPGRRFDAEPLCQATFSLQNLPSTEVSLPGLRVTLLPAPGMAPKHALTAIATPSDGGYAVTFSVDPARVTDETARAVADGFVRVLSRAAADPGRTVADILGPAGPRPVQGPAGAADATGPARTESSHSDSGSATAPTGPVTPTQRRLAELWRDLLALPEDVTPDVHANFFDLGGDSIKLTQLLAWVMDDFGIDLPVQRIHALLDIASLASAIDDAVKERDEAADATLAALVRDVEELTEEELRKRLS